ncbi:hypothetical protein GCM10027449_04170 [Sinomonas notoginsengisoli]
MKLIHRTRWGALLGVGVLVFATAGPISAATLPGTNFDAGNGSLAATSPEVDWTTPAFGVSCSDSTFKSFCRDDLAAGKNDNAFGNGTKEDDFTPSVVSGAIPPNKSDLTRFFAKVKTETNPTTGKSADFAYLAWERQNNPSGTTNMDFELNQSKLVDANGIPVRTNGDILMDFHLANGGTSPTIIWYPWNATSGTCQSAAAPPCWGIGTQIANSSGQIDNFQASVNTKTGQASDPFVGTVLTTAPGVLDPFTFGETAVNLEGAGIIKADSCVTLNNAYVKSRSSDSFTSEVKDFILPINLGFQKCGSITIAKKSIGDVGTFNYTTASTATTIPGSFSLTTTATTNPASVAITPVGSTDTKALRAGTYTFTEETTSGFDPTGLKCNALKTDGSPGTSTAQLTGNTAAAVTLVAGENVTCTFENTAHGAIKVEKTTVGGVGTFNYTDILNGTAGTPFSITTTAAGTPTSNSNSTFASIQPGTYSFTEGSTTGFDLTGLSCTNGTTTKTFTTSTANVSVAPGDNWTCTFTNTHRGTITVHKEDDATPPAALAGAIFTLLDSTGNALPASTADSLTCTTDASGNCSFTNVLPGTYTVRETTTPTGYTTAPDQTGVVVGAGATVPLSFTDPREFTVIVLVCKNADHSLYSSSVSLDRSAPVQSLGSAPVGGPDAATLCGLGGATFSPEGTGSHLAGVNIPQ